MTTPQELLAKLRQYETAESAIAVYKEAAGQIKAFKEVQQAALDCARTEMESDGVLHAKFEHGSVGWTKPRTPKLDRDAWAAVLANDARLQALQDAADRAQAKLEQAQQEAGCMVLPEPRFFIR